MNLSPDQTFGRHWSYNLRNDPKRLLFVLARYGFATQLTGTGKTVLELGCSEGVGAPLFVNRGNRYTGVDLDEPAIATARENFADDATDFIAEDFLGRTYGSFKSIVSLDVVEHIPPELEESYWQTVRANCSEEGIAIIGTPNITAAPYASAASMAGHVNLFSGERLVSAMENLFHNVFLFSMNDEVVHTGFHPMAHFLIALGCYRR